jgi:hypothetical protein
MDVDEEVKKFGRIIGRYLDEVDVEIQDLTEETVEE